MKGVWVRGVGKQVDGLLVPDFRCRRKEFCVHGYFVETVNWSLFCRLSYDFCLEENDTMSGTDCIIQQEEEQDCCSLFF